MGRYRNKPLKLSKKLHGLKFNDGAFKILGSDFQMIKTKLNFDNKLKGMKR